MALVRDIENERTEKDMLKNDMFYDAIELVSKAERFLKRQGFVLTSASSNGKECETHVDIWTKMNHS